MENENTQHTPGPWYVEETTDHFSNYRVMDVQEVTIALIYQQPEDTWDAEANAALIASAPETAKERDELKAINERLKSDIDFFATERDELKERCAVRLATIEEGNKALQELKAINSELLEALNQSIGMIERWNKVPGFVKRIKGIIEKNKK
jgi:predicted nucleotidyltransferase